MKEVALLLPAYNEEKNIQFVIKEAKESLPNSLVVVVDDGSTDRTYELAKELHVTVIKHKKNKGKAEAIKTGLKYLARKNIKYLIITDADRQYTLKDARNFLDVLKSGKVDIVMGYRNPKDVPYANRLGNFIWRSLFNFFFKTNFRDTNCGFIGLRQDTIDKIKNICGGYVLENSILRNAVKANLNIVQIPVKVRYGKRKIGKFAKMFFTVLLFIILEGFKYRLKS